MFLGLKEDRKCTMADVNIGASVTNYVNTQLVKRLLVAKYDDTCNLCFNSIKAGDKIYWYGKGFGSRCITCYMKRDTLLTDKEFDKLSDW
jgi:hypothetical protein